MLIDSKPYSACFGSAYYRYEALRHTRSILGGVCLEAHSLKRTDIIDIHRERQRVVLVIVVV